MMHLGINNSMSRLHTTNALRHSNPTNSINHLHIAKSLSKTSQKQWCIQVQPIADRVTQHLEIISKNFRLSTMRTRILMGFIIYYLVRIVNPMGRILVRWKRFKNNLEIQCHPICNRLYHKLNESSTYHKCTEASKSHELNESVTYRKVNKASQSQLVIQVSRTHEGI